MASSAIVSDFWTCSVCGMENKYRRRNVCMFCARRARKSWRATKPVKKQSLGGRATQEWLGRHICPTCQCVYTNAGECFECEQDTKMVKVMLAGWPSNAEAMHKESEDK